INAANTIGAIAGALLFGLVMVPAFGSSVSQQVLAVLAGGSALLLLGAPRGVGSRGAIELPRAIAATALIAALAILMIQLVPPVSGRVIAVGRRAYDSAIVLESILFAGEGRTSSVAVVDYPSTNSRSIHVGGKVMASTVAEDMRLQRMMGHLPVLMHPNPKTALVIGFGAGVTAGSLVVHPEIERIVICDFEPLMPEIGGRYFAKENYNVIDDPRVEVVVDDARHYIATTREKFDIITSDPLDPWMDGAAVLYTVEFYEYARERLNPGGIVAQWLPLYETDGPSMKSELASFLEVFPDGTVWSSHIPRNGGNDLVMMGSDGPMQVEVDRMASRIRQNPRLAQSLEDVDLGYLITLLATYFGRGSELANWLADAQINRERSLRLQYLAGFSLDVYEEREIYRAMAAHRRYPADILVASPEIEAQVRERWSQ
ncbi:MAG: SAM-dependent methyltransferase, partial [Deltaproteobacteria bacterium]|nr:SAM-dependent methyltransferase [Deltaproteobacteria bacterium]